MYLHHLRLNHRQQGVGRSDMIDESRIWAIRSTFSRASVTRGNVKGAGRASFSQRHRDFLCIRRGFFRVYSYRSWHGVRNALNKVTARL